MSTRHKPLDGMCVLIVEDEPAIALDLEGMFAHLGCTEFHTAGRVTDACSIIETLRPDVAILDLNLHGEPVLPVAARLDEMDVPFLIVRGQSGNHVPTQWLHRVVLKPYDPNEVMFLVERLIKSRCKLQALEAGTTKL